MPSAESVITKRFDAELRASIEVSAITKRTPFVCAPVDRSRLFEEAALRFRFAPDAATSTASHAAFVTIATRPSCRVGRCG